jgi:MFS family permease
VRPLRNLRWWFTGRFVPFFRGPDPRHTRQRNIWHLYQDLIWLGLASAAGSYINVYAIRLGASNRLLGLRASIPSLLVVLLRIPAARWMERTRSKKSLILGGLAAGRLLYLLLFLLPWLGDLPILRQIPPAALLVWLVIVMGIPSVLSSAGWDTFFAEVVPPKRRARVVSMRSTMTNLIMLSVVPLMGSFLDYAPFPANYQVIFLLALAGAAVSTWHVRQVEVSEGDEPRSPPAALNIQEISQILKGSKAFSALVIGTFVYQWAISLASPLFNVYYIEDLGASESWIGWRMTLASLASIVAYRLWPRFVEQRGERTVLVLTTPLMMLFPLLTGLTQTLTPHLFIVLIPRIFGAAVMLSRYNLLLKASPADRRPTFIAVYAILNNVAAFIAPLVGVYLADVISIPGVFFASAGLRLTAALLYRRIPADADVPTAPASAI